ncbi:LysR substrate-binding domain-containing protein [Afifella sp. IM 167]|uniref:LysR substrate-binding domain-containing protein n=1 Tax=Afifella sp. IM 167 TaxID=2033586 RepID=UPI001CCE3D05|nr:LysR substrate-binding domain-containing protein [Afifella sp. IM 167]MBZ8135390.1 hypothetical protein [Afifella sp. IM 167]
MEGKPLVFEASDLFAQEEAACAGLGAVVLPRFMGEANGALVELATPSAPPERELWLVTYGDLRRSSAVRAVSAFLAEEIGRACAQTPGRRARRG